MEPNRYQIAFFSKIIYMLSMSLLQHTWVYKDKHKLRKEKRKQREISPVSFFLDDFFLKICNCLFGRGKIYKCLPNLKRSCSLKTQDCLFQRPRNYLFVSYMRKRLQISGPPFCEKGEAYLQQMYLVLFV